MGGDGKTRFIPFGECGVLIPDHVHYHDVCSLGVKASCDSFDLADLAIIKSLIYTVIDGHCLLV